MRRCLGRKHRATVTRWSDNQAEPKTKMNIKITAENPENITSFEPISGTFACNDASSDEVNENVPDVFKAIEAFFDDYTDELLKIELFQSNGHAVGDGVPAFGHFLATRNQSRLHLY